MAERNHPKIMVLQPSLGIKGESLTSPMDLLLLLGWLRFLVMWPTMLNTIKQKKPKYPILQFGKYKKTPK